MRKILLAIFAFATMSMFASDLQLWQNSTLNKIIQRGELRGGRFFPIRQNNRPHPCGYPPY